VDKVLIVDDELRIISLVRHHLEFEGYEGVAATDAQEAWRLLVEEVPNAAIIDLRLPGGMDGWMLIDKIRTDGRFSKLPIVVLTGMLEPDVVQRAADKGCEYMGKPFSADALMDKLKVAMARGDKLPGAAPRVAMRSTPVVMLLGEYRVDGSIHLPPEIPRFSDSWEALIRDGREFVPVTDATVVRLDDGQVITEAGFIQVRKDQIRGVFPVE
jgi:CheY-like chemotaxis protein